MKEFRRSLVLTGIAVLPLCILTSASVAYAQERATDRGPVTLVTPLVPDPLPSYGTASTAVLTVPAWAFQAWDDSVQSHVGYNRFSPSAQEVEAPVFLPAGAQITSIELEGCDTSASSQVVFILYRIASNGGTTTLSDLGGTGTTATPGCSTFPLALSVPHTVDNANVYAVAVKGGTTSATSYTAVRVKYHLQVSPAPSVATFSDVPVGSIYFPFVEALYASGITAGCGGGNFCPNSPLTRGQMAVFLATALGLHWPN